MLKISKNPLLIGLQLPPRNLNVCYVCKKTEDAKRCSRCKSISYCDRACQEKDWPRHKLECGIDQLISPQEPPLKKQAITEEQQQQPAQQQSIPKPITSDVIVIDDD